MQNNRFGRRSYATAVATDDVSDGIAPGSFTRQNMMNRAMNEGRNLRKEAESKKRYFQQKLNLEGNRKKLGKGNIITFLMNDENQGIDKSDINKVLRISGFSVGDVEGIKLNDFRSNQVEVLLKEGFQVDVQVIEDRLKNAHIDAAVSKFDHIEEFIMIYGLPLTSDVDALELKIIDSLKPFVKKVLDIVPCKHKAENSDDFFSGHYDGNWRLKVCPKDRQQVPNFIVVGQDSKVMGKVVYTRKVSPKEEMCSDCFSTRHYKKDPDCPGLRDWSDYCEEFERKWAEVSLVEGDLDEVATTNDIEEARLSVLSKNLVKNVEKLEKEKNELVNTLKEHEMNIKKVDDLQTKVDDLVSTKAQLQKERNELLDTVNNQVVVINKVDDLEKVKAELELRLVDFSKETEENSKRLNQELRAIADENKDLKIRLSDMVAENANLASVNTNLEGQIEEAETLVSEKHITFQRIGSQSSNKLVEFQDLDSSLEKSPASTSLEKLEQSTAIKRSLESPGNSPPDKKILNYPDVGKKVWVQMKDGNKPEYLVQSKKNKNTFNVVNSEGLRISKNFRDLTWGYISEDGGRKNSK